MDWYNGYGKQKGLLTGGIRSARPGILTSGGRPFRSDISDGILSQYLIHKMNWTKKKRKKYVTNLDKEQRNEMGGTMDDVRKNRIYE